MSRTFSYSSAAQPNLHSFPTRRSSDLLPAKGIRSYEGTYAYAFPTGQHCTTDSIATAAHDRTESVVQCCKPGKDRRSTRLNSSHRTTSYARVWLAKKTHHRRRSTATPA